MRTHVAATALLAGLAGLAAGLTACGTDDGPRTAVDRGGATPSASPPTAVPAAPGQVRSGLVTVMDTGDGPELCLGPVAESYPPQCSGPDVAGWSWKAQAPVFERQGDTRWGTFAVTGSWDGTTFTVADAVPGALYDPAPEPPPALPAPSRQLDQAELDALATELANTVPGVQSTSADQAGHVLVDVTYDDGTLQDYVDAAYGDGVVVVTGALVDA